MPQLDFATFTPQIIWLILTFVTLYLVMARVALPRIGGIIEQRRDRIADDLDQAAKLKTETEQAIQTYRQALADARAHAHDIAQKTRDQLTTETAAQKKAANDQLAAHIAAADARIKAAKDAALGHLADIAANTTEAIVSRLLGSKASAETIKQAIAAELGK